MEENGEIVVFQQFDSTIAANIIKAKLDAYGIPCFLTEENLANLYPGQQNFFFQVRLHLFRADVEHAQQVLTENNMALHDDSGVACPRCHSTDVQREFPARINDHILASLKVLFFGVLFPQHKVNRCQQCQFEF